MLLTKTQIKYIEERRKEIRRIQEYEPKVGWLSLQTELQQLNMFIVLHNAERKAQEHANKQ